MEQPPLPRTRGTGVVRQVVPRGLAATLLLGCLLLGRALLGGTLLGSTLASDLRATGNGTTAATLLRSASNGATALAALLRCATLAALTSRGLRSTTGTRGSRTLGQRVVPLDGESDLSLVVHLQPLLLSRRGTD